MPNYHPNKALDSLVLELGLVLSSSALGIMTLITCVYFYLEPLTTCLIGSAIPENFFFPPFRIFMVYLFPHYLSLAMLAIINTNGASLVIYGALFTPFIVRELCLDRRKNYKTSERLRRPLHLLLTFRSAQILQIRFLQAFQYIIVPSQTIVMQIVFLSTFMLIKHNDKVSTATSAMLGSWSLCSAATWCTFLSMGGYLHWYGRKTLMSWKYHQWASSVQKKHMSKFRRSCRPLTINMGRTYVITRLTVLKFMRGLSRGVFRTLLTLDKK